jgi:hypothetical protein
MQLFMMGIMGEYIAKMFSEVKARPIYFVAEQSLKTAEDTRTEDQTTRTAAE